jgi:hypothetical protein
MHPDEIFCPPECEASEIEESPRALVMSKETILKQGCELSLNTFQLFGVSGQYRISYS